MNLKKKAKLATVLQKFRGETPTGFLFKAVAGELEKVRTQKGDKGDSYELTEQDKKDIAKSIEVPVVERVVEKIVEKTEIVQQVAQEIDIKEVAKNALEQLRPELYSKIYSLIPSGGGNANRDILFNSSVLSRYGDINFITGSVMSIVTALNDTTKRVDVTISNTGSDTGITELTGDVTAGPGSGAQVATLASVLTAGGPYGSSTSIPIVTWDARGRLTAVSSVATLTLSGSTYTASFTNVANLDSTPGNTTATFLRVGNTVTVSGVVTVNPTLTATSTQVGISLPIASDFANASECAGVAFSPAIAGQGAAILGDITNNRAQMQWISADITAQDMYFNFTYQVI